MAIVGLNFTKINVEKKKPLQGSINIKDNVSITDVQDVNLSLGTVDQKGLRFEFEFSANYEPDLAVISLKGEVLVMLEEAKVKETLDKWKKDKKVPSEIATPVLNQALEKSNIKALILSEDLGLPPPVPLPKIEAKKK